MTRSEIPQLEVITAIPDADREDFVAQLLFSQGWSIIYRAFDGEALGRYIEERGTSRRTVIVYQSYFPGFDETTLLRFNSPAITFISLDDIPFTSHEIMVAIRGSLRAPMLQADQLVIRAQEDLPATQPRGAMIQRAHREGKSSARERRVIAVTGTSGAPGRTRFAAALAAEISSKGPTMLIDADIRSQGAIFRTSQSAQFELVPLDRESKPTRIPEGVEHAVVDLGILPGLAEAVNDRRWYGSLVNNVMDQASQLIYISKSTSASMSELSQFIREYPLLLKRLPISYICVLSGHSRELREWESKFLTLTMGENRYILRDGELNLGDSGKVLSIFKSGKSGQRSIAKIAAALG